MTTTTTSDDLRGQLAAVEGRQIELVAERDEISYGAIVEGDAKAVKRLAEINSELGNITNQTASLTAALREAGRRTAAASAAEAEEGERLRAERAAPIVERLALRGQALDAALQCYVENFVAAQREIDQLIGMGIPMTTRSLTMINMDNAHDSAMLAFGNRNARPVRVRRRTFTELVDGWCLPPRNWIANKLTTTAQKAA
jgi:hypothetical protein